ncbi:putative Tyrosinase copper-binding domain-containing protein [Seiridium cardinale]|uniref:Tyrosinase copper-binding domain-containing protein n=1 Tax=Seiridium cardinale TaxID=138064 RepID=A0ABR2XP08_9PEZI
MKMTRLLTTLLGAAIPAYALCTTRAISTCSTATAVTRKEYGQLTDVEKLSFISAIQCVMAKPSVLNDLVPATTNKFDDYAAVHVNNTLGIHINGVFLSWHRHFVYLMETELHACGFPQQLGIPYWNWALYTDLESSPMFDGSETSLGSNGAYDPDSGDVYSTPGGTILPHGTGGGCVTSGPFANHTVNFQKMPFDLVFSGLPANWTEADPHCMTRDLNSYGVQTYANQSDIDSVLSSEDIATFQSVINGDANSPGIHGGGHYAIGGTGYDFFGSPQDPAFFLHHSMIDKVWTDWQAVDPANRRYVYAGTSTIFNGNSTANVDNSTVIDFGRLGSATVEDVQDPTTGPYCYQYE